MSLNLTPREQTQIYVNESFGHITINRALSRLYDNDIVVFNTSMSNLAWVSGVFDADIAALDARVTDNENDIVNIQAILGVGSGSAMEWNSAYSTLNTLSSTWNSTTSTVNAGSTEWDSAYSTVNTASATWGAGGGTGSTTFSGLTDTDANPAFLTNDDQLKWSTSSSKWIAYSPPAVSYTTASEVSGIVESYDNVREWSDHGDNLITDRKHLTDDWQDALNAADTPSTSNPIAVLNDLTKYFTPNNMMHVINVKNDGVDGGTFTAGSRQQRELNVVKSNTITGATVVSDDITLLSGNYYIEGVASAHEVGAHKAWLYDSTGAADVVSGTTVYGDVPAPLVGTFALTGASVVRVMHQGSVTVPNSGFGVATGFGDPEIYTNITIYKFG